MTLDLKLEESAVSAQLEKKLTVKRSWLSKAIDSIRSISLDDILNHWKAITFTVGATALVCFAVLYDANRKHVIDLADEAKTGAVAEFSMDSEHESYVQKISGSTGVDRAIIEALLYAAKSNPAYVASARASGKRGIIPLDPAAVGIVPELLDSDPALCIEAAAEHYARLRKKSGSDLEAVAGVVAGFDNAQGAVNLTSALHINSCGGKEPYGSCKEYLEKHKFTLDIIEKHKKGVLRGFDYYNAITKGLNSRPGYSKRQNERYKKRFEKIISSPPHDPERFLIHSRYNPWVKVLRPEIVREYEDILMTAKDFTLHLPENSRNAVASARDYLNTQKARGGSE